MKTGYSVSSPGWGLVASPSQTREHAKCSPSCTDTFVASTAEAWWACIRPGVQTVQAPTKPKTGVSVPSSSLLSAPHCCRTVVDWSRMMSLVSCAFSRVSPVEFTVFCYLFIHPNFALLFSVPHPFAEVMVLQRKKALSGWRSGGWNFNSRRRQLR